MPKSDRVFNILVIDDNPADGVMLRHAWSECKDVQADVTVIQDSRSAMPYLRGGASRTPDLVMLDYKHPLNGGLTLAEIKSDPELNHLPVIVLSGSSDPNDYLEAYRRHANICFRKPMDADDFISLVCQVADTWLVKAVLSRC